MTSGKKVGVQGPKPNFTKKFKFGQSPKGIDKRLQCHKNSYIKNFGILLPSLSKDLNLL